jgi:hypothetical protein
LRLGSHALVLRRFVSSEHLLLALSKDARFGSGAPR